MENKNATRIVPEGAIRAACAAQMAPEKVAAVITEDELFLGVAPLGVICISPDLARSLIAIFREYLAKRGHGAR